MLKIRNREIEHEGSTSELLVDASMALDFVYDRLETEIGHFGATKLLIKMTFVVLKRKREERKCNTQKQ